MSSVNIARNTNLDGLQHMALFTKAVTTVLGLVQVGIVVKILSKPEFGLVGLVMTIGGVIGVSQHLGIVDGTIREIAVLRDRREMSKVFWVSQMVRQSVTIPLSVCLLLLAGWISDEVYGRPQIEILVQIFAASLILQGLQDVLGATLTGMKRFKPLYTIQIITATLNVVIFACFTWLFGMPGYFWAIILTTSIMVGLLAVVVLREFGGDMPWPGAADFKKYFTRVFRIGAFMYLARIFFFLWHRMPLLLLGGVLTTSQLGSLSASLAFGSRLTIAAMALSEVNLSWMSSLFAKERGKFVQIARDNMQRVLVVMMAMTLVILFFGPDVLSLLNKDYSTDRQLIILMTVAFFFYSLIDIGSSSVFVPADKPHLRAVTYGVMMVITAAVVGFLFLTVPSAMWAAVAVLTGSVVAYVLMLVISRVQFGARLLTWQLVWFLLILVASASWLLAEPSLTWRVVVFFLLTIYILREAHRSQLLPKLAMTNVQLAMTKIIVFAGAEYGAKTWTNRQQIMSRVSKQHSVLYVEPRVWILRLVARHWKHPGYLLRFAQRVVWYEKKSDRLFIKSQWNLIPGSREIKAVAGINHWLNRWNVLLTAKLLGFRSPRVMWIYDTESAEYLSAFNQDKVIYDCVDDHAAQAGPDRNPQRVEEEEAAIISAADLVTVTSKRLLELKGKHNQNVRLVLNAGDVELFAASLTPGDRRGQTPGVFPAANRPVLGSVGALDAYKIDFEMLYEVALGKADWEFRLIGAPVVSGERGSEGLDKLAKLPNVKLLGAIDRKKVPKYVKDFDVCLIPYRNNRYNAASFPLKFWEFMATGKPVVVSGLPELKEFDNLIGYAESADELIKKIEVALARPTENSEARRKLAGEHSWEKRAEKLLELLNKL